ncbi:hypothetical protein T492DRAFT_873252, partial [Pavlovales sp. CCMP2436]
MHLRSRTTLVSSLLRALEAFPVVFDVAALREVFPVVFDVADLRENALELIGSFNGTAPYAEVALGARNFLSMKQEKPPAESLADLRADLAKLGAAELAEKASMQVPVALAAHEAYIRRIYK